MEISSFYTLLKEKFSHQPTAMQDAALQQLSAFVFSEKNDELFLLKGFAGTGKTILISVLVNNLWRVAKKSLLLAPTGRAAKVIANYSGREAHTIHKKIYFPRKQKNGSIQFVLAPNKHRDTLFIVDEASMISDVSTDSKLFDNGALLDDLMMFVYSGHHCKLIFVGDVAQLPPVHLSLSPALDKNHLSLHYHKRVTEIELDEVVRQEEDSGILANATYLREHLKDDTSIYLKFDVKKYCDIVKLSDGYEIQDAIHEAYNRNGLEETAIIVRSNKRANLYNQQIRSKILFHEHQLAVGDYLMVIKNNYFWLKPLSEAGFIANGDIIEIMELFSIKELYGFTFAEVKIKMVDYPNQKPFETVLLLDTIKSETAALSYEDSNRLYQEILKDYVHETATYKKFLKVKNNTFFNALHVKFSYAVTCHKAQGGQWNTVFVEQPYLLNGIDREYIRWLYTAVTRAKLKLYLLGFSDNFFS
jgi:exodeoxyribonuclease V